MIMRPTHKPYAMRHTGSTFSAISPCRWEFVVSANAIANPQSQTSAPLPPIHIANHEDVGNAEEHKHLPIAPMQREQSLVPLFGNER